MNIFEDVIDHELQELHDQGVQLRHFGPPGPVWSRCFAKKSCTRLSLPGIIRRLILNIAFNYGGRDEIVCAIQCMIRDGVEPG